MERLELEEMVDAGLTVRQIAARSGKAYSTVRYWLQRHGLATRHRGPGRSTNFSDGAFVCRRHGAAPFVRDSHGTRCSKCRSEQVSRRRQRVKQILVAEAGGCCVLCGYDRYVGALQFHHRDPAQKRFQLGAAGLTRSLAAMREEAAKCSLLCANCHAELEGGIVTLV